MSKKLLLADDSITIQKVIQITFAHEDYELTITDNGDAALSKAMEIKPDLILADVYMPGKNGYELAMAVKQDPALQHIPVLLLAGSFEPFDEDKARSCKADAWIEKPFESQSLIDKVAELLSAAQIAQPAPPPAEPAAFVEPEVAAPDLSAFDEPLEAEQEMSTSADDPFGDISFEEEPVAAVATQASSADDWSDVVLESDDEVRTEEVSTTDDEPESATDEDFVFAEETSEVAEPFAPVADAGFDEFEIGEEEIMPLDDDDIIGAEDLEPVMEEQTLVSWSRVETGREDFFDEPPETPQPADTPFEDEPFTFEEAPAFAEEAPAFAEEAPAFAEEAPAFAEEAPAFAEEAPAFAEEAPAFAEEAPAFAEEAPVFAEEAPAFGEEAPAFGEEAPAFGEEAPAFGEEAPAFGEEAQPVAVVANGMDVEAKVSGISEAEIELIIEKVVTNVVEKLAGSILEKVAWEVVPGLAENLIREEIRKIKDAAA